MEGPVRTLLWRRLDVPGLEHFRLSAGAAGPRLAGTILLAHAGAPLHVEYEIECAADWRTRRVTVLMAHGGAARRMELDADGDGRWRSGGAELPAVAGCRDVDLSLTPATNTLPLRRLPLAIGESREVAAAWVLFPELEVRRLTQTYTRLDAQRLHYASDTGFSTEIEVDDGDLVVRYPPFWERVAAANAP
ncbi:MAG TPA: putative glycolipid-binding domain-containing protein [Thermoanaerobaculia bacterium]|nr:putative glycolipid-binding domain-containing protein [Thermoanaerobaculia bacterium]